MNEELVNKLLQYLNSAEALAAEHLPDIAQQALEFGLWSSYIKIGVVILILLASITCFIIGLLNDIEPLSTLGAVIASIMLLISPVVISMSVTDIVKIKTAPKLYLIQEIGKMRK